MCSRTALSSHHADARIELFAYIESYCNTHGKHSSLGYKIPTSFEAQIDSINYPPSLPTLRAVAMPRTGINNARESYLDFIRIENAPHHVAGKLSMMRRFFGSERVEALAGRRSPATSNKNWAVCGCLPGVFGNGLSTPITSHHAQTSEHAIHPPPAGQPSKAAA